MFTKKSSASIALSRLLIELSMIRGLPIEQPREITAVRCEHCQAMVAPGSARTHPCWVERS